jgi:glycosyltransferase involved in cell wall biosynthesis
MREIEGLVSISIPFYNSERFLAETIESVLAQTYMHWELLLVDDGSADNSTAIALKCAEDYNGRIRYLEHADHRNFGLTRTRNLGAASSNGEYLAFLDSDDVWHPCKLEQQVALLNAHPEAGLVYGRSEYWYDWDEIAHSEQKNHIPLLAPGSKQYFPTELLTETYPFGVFGAPCPSSFLMRRSAFDRVGGFVEDFNPNTFQVFEDIAFLSKIYLDVPVFVSDACWDKYRCSSSSMWHSAKATGSEEAARQFYFRWLRQYLLEHGITDPEIWRAVRKQTWVYWLPLPAFGIQLLRRIGNRLSR